MRRVLLVGLVGLVGLLLTGCGSAAATVTPVPAPTPTVDVAPTATRAAELAQLATAQASPRPVVVVIATAVPPTPDTRAQTYLSAAQNGLRAIHATITPVVRACSSSSGGDCLRAYETAWTDFQPEAAAVQALRPPSQCQPLNTAVQQVVDTTGSYLVAIKVLATNGSSERAFEDGTLPLLTSVNAAFDAATATAVVAACH